MESDNCPFKLNMEFEPGVKINDDLYFYFIDFSFFPFKSKIDILPESSRDWIREKFFTVLEA